MKTKKIPYDQFSIELDKLMFGGQVENLTQAEERIDTIEAFMDATNYTWDDVLEGMFPKPITN